MLPAQSEDGKMEEIKHAEASVETKWMDTMINFHSAAKWSSDLSGWMMRLNTDSTKHSILVLLSSHSASHGPREPHNQLTAKNGFSTTAVDSSTDTRAESLFTI